MQIVLGAGVHILYLFFAICCAVLHLQLYLYSAKIYKYNFLLPFMLPAYGNYIHAQRQKARNE